MKTFRSQTDARAFNQIHVSPWALSVTVLVCSVVWFVDVCVLFAAYAITADLSAISEFWMLTLILMPMLCFAFGNLLVNVRCQSRLSRFDWCVLAAAFFPVTLGSWLAFMILTSLRTSAQDAPVGLKILGVLASLALVAITGRMLWQTTRKYLAGKTIG